LRFWLSEEWRVSWELLLFEPPVVVLVFNTWAKDFDDESNVRKLSKSILDVTLLFEEEGIG